MAYGDYDGPNKPDKGKEGGSCNRTRCQAAPALHYNHGSNSWYCRDCRDQTTTPSADAIGIGTFQTQVTKCSRPVRRWTLEKLQHDQGETNTSPEQP
jgi:hypothetical protein